MKNFCALLVLAVVCVSGYLFYTNTARQDFLLSGTVTVAENLVKQAQADNNTCSIIVKNEADVPIAIKRVINPAFPMDFTITKDDMLIGELTGNVKVEVEINGHGNLGVLKAGDIFGAAEGSFAQNTKGILVVADKRTGMPKFTSRSKGNFFRTAAR